MLAGVSVDYYVRLERGDLTGASDSVLEALARALQLDEAECAHLFDLAHAADTSGRARRPSRIGTRSATIQTIGSDASHTVQESTLNRTTQTYCPWGVEGIDGISQPWRM